MYTHTHAHKDTTEVQTARETASQIGRYKQYLWINRSNFNTKRLLWTTIRQQQQQQHIIILTKTTTTTLATTPSNNGIENLNFQKKILNVQCSMVDGNIEGV